jgi:hypothetical protein
VIGDKKYLFKFRSTETSSEGIFRLEGIWRHADGDAAVVGEVELESILLNIFRLKFTEET